MHGYILDIIMANEQAANKVKKRTYFDLDRCREKVIL